MDIKKTKLVLSGGGVKGIVHIGVLYALEQLKMLDDICDFAGTSVGCIVIALHVIGYKPLEMYDFIKNLELDSLRNISIMNIHLFGLDTGSKLEYTLKRLIINKGLKENITMSELFAMTRKRMIFTTVCVNTTDVCYLSHETYPELELLTALRMTSAIPFIYCPVIYDDEIYIDGACFNDYPINMFDDHLDQTIGIMIINSKDKIYEIDSLETYILRVLKCVAIGLTYNGHKGYEKCTIKINIDSIIGIDYDIDDTKKDEMFIKGYDGIVNNLDKLI